MRLSKREKRSRDLIAFTLILLVPIFLVLIVVYEVKKQQAATARWEADAVNNPSHPQYLAPAIKSLSSLHSCLATKAFWVPDMVITKLYMPMVSPPSVGYLINIHEQEIQYHRTATTFGVISEGACKPDQTALPKPFMSIVSYPSSLVYNYTTAGGTTICAHCTMSSDAVKAKADCYATTVWPYWDENLSTQMSTKETSYRFVGTAGFTDFVVMGQTPTSTLNPATLTIPKATQAGVEIWWEGREGWKGER